MKLTKQILVDLIREQLDDIYRDYPSLSLHEIQEQDDQPNLPSDMSVPAAATPWPPEYYVPYAGDDPGPALRAGEDPMSVYKRLGYLPWLTGNPIYAGKDPVAFEEPGFERYRDAVKAGVATGYDPHDLPRIPLAKTLEEAIKNKIKQLLN